MKTFLCIFLLAAFALVSPKPAHAYVNSALGVVVRDSQGAITTSAYTEVVHSLAKAVKGISISNSSSSGLVLAIGASGSEQDQIEISGGGVPGSQPGTTFYPIPLSQGLRVALKARDSAAAIGQQILNFFYY